MVDCALCGTKESTIIMRDSDKIYWYSCYNCGDFIITDTAERKIQRDKYRRADLSEKSKQCRKEEVYLKIWNNLDKLMYEVLSEEQFKFEIKKT